MGQVPKSVIPLSFFLFPLQAMESHTTAKFAFVPPSPRAR